MSLEDDDGVEEIPPSEITYTDAGTSTGARVKPSIRPCAAMGRSQPPKSQEITTDITYLYDPPDDIAMSPLATPIYTRSFHDSRVTQNRRYTESDSCNFAWNGWQTDRLLEPVWRDLEAEDRAEEEAAAAAEAKAQEEREAAEREAYHRAVQRASTNPGYMDPCFPDSNLDSMGAPPFYPSRATHAAQMTTDSRLRQPTTSADTRPFAAPGRTSGLPQSETPRVAGNRKTTRGDTQMSGRKEKKNETKTFSFSKVAGGWYKRSMGFGRGLG